MQPKESLVCRPGGERFVIHYQGPQSTLQIQTEVLDVDTTPSRYQFLEQFDSH